MNQHRFSTIISGERFLRFSCTMQQTSATLSIVVVISFWYFIRHPINFTSINDHGVTALLHVTDLFLSVNAMRFSSTIHKPFIVAICYLVWSLILGLFFSKSVYKALDWENKPGASSINVIINFILLVIIHGLLCMIKKWILRIYMHESNQDDDIEMDEVQNSKHLNTEEFQEDLMEDGATTKTSIDNQVYGNVGDSDIEMQSVPI